MEVEKQAALLGKEVGNVKGELIGVMRVARQEKEKLKLGVKEREELCKLKEGEEEGNQLLCKMQERLKELKAALGGRVKHLEAELLKSETAREELRGKKDADMVQLQRQVDLKEHEVERLTNDKNRLLQQLEMAWKTSP